MNTTEAADVMLGELYAAGLPLQSVADRLNAAGHLSPAGRPWTVHSVGARRLALAIPCRLTVPGRIADPSPEEIAARCEEIRRGWSRAEEARRRLTLAPDWTPPIVAMTALVDPWGVSRVRKGVAA